MSIKVTLGEVKTQENKPFPKLMMYSKDKDFIVLFINKDEAVCLYSNTKEWKVGDYENDMAISDFIEYNGPITIQNA